jgi:cytochrome d ubiquinol oxidase subunit II
MRTAEQRLNGVVFAASSVITPFCFGAIAGGVASGRVPVGGYGNAVTSWINPTSMLGGVLAVLTCGYLAAIFLTAEARRQADVGLEGWARRRAVGAAVAAGLVGGAGLVVLDADAHRLYVHLLRDGWACIALSVVAGLLALWATIGGLPRLAFRVGSFEVRLFGVRVLGVLAVAAILAGWGVAQYPYLLGTHLTIRAAAGPAATMRALGVVTLLAVALVGPSLVALLILTDEGRLTTD